MTTTREFSSTDAGAPVLTGQAGSLLAVIKACLVDGYGSRPAAGWTFPYSGTNKGVFRNAVGSGGTGHYFRIADDATEAAGARVALLRGYVDMSDVDTGVGADVMPAVSNYSTGGQICKSNTLDATARAWRIFADELTCYIWTDPNAAFMHGIHGFGDFESVVPGDSFRSFVLHQYASWATGSGASRIHGPSRTGFATPTLVQSTGLSVMRSYSGAAAGSILANNAPLGSQQAGYGAGYSGGASAPIPTATNPGSSDRYFHRLPIISENGIRGYMRGMYACLNDLRSLSQGATESGSSGLPMGSVLRLMRCSSGNNAAGEGVVAIETAVVW